jgi:hypothetical protein
MLIRSILRFLGRYSDAIAAIASITTVLSVSLNIYMAIANSQQDRQLKDLQIRQAELENTIKEAEIDARVGLVPLLLDPDVLNPSGPSLLNNDIFKEFRDWKARQHTPLANSHSIVAIMLTVDYIHENQALLEGKITFRTRQFSADGELAEPIDQLQTSIATSSWRDEQPLRLQPLHLNDKVLIPIGHVEVPESGPWSYFGTMMMPTKVEWINSMDNAQESRKVPEFFPQADWVPPLHEVAPVITPTATPPTTISTAVPETATPNPKVGSPTVSPSATSSVATAAPNPIATSTPDIAAATATPAATAIVSLVKSGQRPPVLVIGGRTNTVLQELKAASLVQMNLALPSAP